MCGICPGTFGLSEWELVNKIPASNIYLKMSLTFVNQLANQISELFLSALSQDKTG